MRTAGPSAMHPRRRHRIHHHDVQSDSLGCGEYVVGLFVSMYVMYVNVYVCYTIMTFKAIASRVENMSWDFL